MSEIRVVKSKSIQSTYTRKERMASSLYMLVDALPNTAELCPAFKIHTNYPPTQN
jgi:hypothetical protein